ncbi:MAG: RNA methyltransferase [Candidatus Cloacimonetes bacterium]|nr:RNA methyltransferase [Candidatus Cloacimonadota bacterium]
MKKIMQYSQDKFNSFTDEKKIRIITSFVNEIDKLWQDEEKRKNLLVELENCLEYVVDSSNRDLSNVLTRAKRLQSKTHLEFMTTFTSLLTKYSKEPRDHDLMEPRQNESKKHLTVPLYAILENLRSAFNVGSIIRTSECFGVRKVYMCGYTPTPDNIKVKKTSMATDEWILWERRKDILELIDQLKEQESIRLVALETSPDAQPIQLSSISQPAVIIVGNEAHGLSKEVLEKADQVLKIPLSGRKESFNVGVAYGIACYEILRKWDML